MQSTAVVKIRRSSLSTQTIRFSRDRELQQKFQALKDCRKDFDELSGWLMKQLDMPVNKKKQFLADIVQKYLPTAVYDWAPMGLTKWIAAETNAAEMEERLLRENVNNVQRVLNNLIASAREESQILADFAEDIKKANEEKWTARELHEYLTKAADLEVSDEITNLLDEKFDILSSEMKEKRRLEILSQLEHNAMGRKKLIEAEAEGCYLGLEVWHMGVSAYFDYMTIIRPLNVIYKSAEGMMDMNKAAYTAKEVVIKKLSLAKDAFKHITEITARAHEYAVSGKDTLALFDQTTEELRKHIGRLETIQREITTIEPRESKLIESAAIS